MPGKSKKVQEEYVARMSDFVRFIMDTGCGFDLIDAATARLFPLAIRKVDPMDIHTASGTTTFNTALEFHVNPLDEKHQSLCCQTHHGFYPLECGVRNWVTVSTGSHTRTLTSPYLTVRASTLRLTEVSPTSVWMPNHTSTKQ